ncbi:iron-sulfur cluster biosynthesis family protein [Lactiplantibacillus sp. DA1]|uniref:iron-sulfur cluster biosynthesis family protein n=1 Tax=Lactiplantibacillus sp. DA1 TaxID=3079857 RepID=UPI00292A6564|nr:iron-sulfur cluster biosynthesis family protein [Lactiplantibacillus sp. DA1]MDV0430443.1 iron-sulfur cluster biosynthesis family protein [Lactiplantibacillus sp. DA1]
MSNRQLTFDSAVVNKLSSKLDGQKRLLLTFEDGVGAFSQHAMLHMQTQFTLNIVTTTTPIDGYNTILDSNLGPVAVKDYSVADLQQTMTIRLNSHQNTLQLNGEGGMIDDNVGFIDFTDPDGIKKNPSR